MHLMRTNIFLETFSRFCIAMRTCLLFLKPTTPQWMTRSLSTANIQCLKFPTLPTRKSFNTHAIRSPAFQVIVSKFNQTVFEAATSIMISASINVTIADCFFITIQWNRTDEVSKCKSRIDNTLWWRFSKYFAIWIFAPYTYTLELENSNIRVL